MAELASTITVKIELSEDLKLAIETFDKRLNKIEQCLFGHAVAMTEKTKEDFGNKSDTDKIR